VETSLNTNGLRVFGYVRVSTKDQVEKGISMKDQPEKIRAFAAFHKLDLVEILEDAGESSKSLERPALLKILSRMKAGEAAGIVVSKIDRLTRHVGDMCRLVEEYFTDERWFHLLSASDHIETRTANGRAMLYMMIVFSQHQREMSAENTAGIMARKRRTHERGGNLRFGTKVDAGDGRRSRKGNPVALVPCPEDLAIQDRIVSMRRDYHLSLRQIANVLNEEQIPSKRGVTKRSTGLWSKSSVAEILKRAEEPSADAS
jgi:site-specific DNA recombinase